MIRRPLTQTGRLERRTGLRRITVKAARRFDADERRRRREVRREVFARDGGCRLAGGRWGRYPSCFGPLTPHHLRKASQSGGYTADNLVALCAHHNTMVEDHPAEAYALGLVVKSWEAR